ncbi:MAG TPA: TlpA disulfide reductase family protein [Chitinophagaceae bacterium]|nr:TlpA disulfide reductase family protein [Chitinophagaceae bacterium]
MNSSLKVIFLLLVFIYWSCSSNLKTDVPDISGKQLNGSTISLQELAKDKVTVVNVWSTFCGPCLEELPMLHNLYDNNKNNSQFAFITMALNTNDELTQFISAADTSNPYHKVFILSKLKEFRLPTIAGLSKGFIIKNTEDGKFQAHLPSSKEFEILRQALGFGPIPFTVIYDKHGKISYKTDYKGDVESNLVRYQDSLQHKIDELLYN